MPTSEPTPSLDLRSSIVYLIGALAYSSPATDITAVIAVARVEISFGAFVISSQCEVYLNGVSGGEIEKIKDIAFSMEP